MSSTEPYEGEKLTISVVKANIYGLLLIIPVAIIFGLPYYLFWGNFGGFQFDGITILIALVGGIIVHELLHGITWALYADGGFKSIRFGVMWKVLAPYCHCKEPLTLRAYLWGAVMPAIILGFLPALAAIILGSMGLLYFGFFFTIAAIGDFMTINLLRNEDKDALVQDHPSEAGCIIYREGRSN